MSKWITTSFLGFLLALSSGAMELRQSILGNDGTIYSVQVGTYAELFPEEGEIELNHSVLALEVAAPGSVAKRLLVPGTSGLDEESAPGLFLSRASGILRIVWQSTTGDATRLYSTGFDSKEWAQTYEHFSDPEGGKPALVFSRDSLGYDDEDGNAVFIERHVMHLFQPRHGADAAVTYTPHIFINGRFAGVGGPFPLYHFNPNPNEEVSSRLAEFMDVSLNDDEDIVTLMFGSSASGRVTTYQISNLKMALADFGDEVRNGAMQVPFDPSDVSSFAGGLGAYLVPHGRRSRINTGILEFLQDGIYDWLMENGSNYHADEVDVLAVSLRDLTLSLSASLTFPTTAVAAPKSGGGVIEIDVGDLFGDETIPAFVMDLQVAVERPLPDAGDSRIRLFPSHDGLAFVASWTDAEDEDLLWYVESLSDATWTAPQAIRLTEELSLRKAYDLLRDRIE